VLAALLTPLALWALLRSADRDVSVVLSLALLGAAVVVGPAVAVLVARLSGVGERYRGLLVPLVAVTAATAVLLELSWFVFKDVIGKVDWPSAKQRIPFPQIDVVTGSAVSVGGVTIQRSAIFTILALAVCAALLWYFINRTRLGRGMQAVSQDPDTARLMGINVDRIIVVAFALGAVLAAVAGISQGFQNNNIDFRMGFLAGLKAFTAAVLGGIGNVQGAVVGGLVLGVVEAMADRVRAGPVRRWILEGRVGLRDPHPGARLPSAGPSRCKGGGPRMSSQLASQAPVGKGAGDPQTPPAANRGWPLALGGAVLVIVGAFLSWSYDSSILGDLSLMFYPVVSRSWRSSPRSSPWCCCSRSVGRSRPGSDPGSTPSSACARWPSAW
jgi:branched-subunit amino acid ABC-type transport system permease component